MNHMKLGHTVALAFMGWYLMMPPVNDLVAPLNQWFIIDSFDQASECRLDRKSFYEDGLSRTRNPKNKSDFDLGKEYLRCTCIETDDPRLKGN